MNKQSAVAETGTCLFTPGSVARDLHPLTPGAIASPWTTSPSCFLISSQFPRPTPAQPRRSLPLSDLCIPRYTSFSFLSFKIILMDW